MQFKLTIDLGNAAMSDKQDLGLALQALGDAIYGQAYYEDRTEDGIVRDANGNTVGRWTLTQG